MMETTALVTAAFDLLAPYASQAGGILAGKAAEGVAAQAVKLWGWLTGKIAPGVEGHAALERYSQTPDDPRRRTAAELAVEDFLTAHPDSLAELRALLAEAGVTVTEVTQTMTVTGHGNKPVQVSGSDIRVKIG
ncbi:hypothetical protein [Phaeospirillum tilakii]|uniref:Uncharacterized protein n=1 Tax=Phaeospirillum tilakii TaxID=741673 RepID=A0ABW5CFK4_9PROT